jgi:hypothetical protein
MRVHLLLIAALLTGEIGAAEYAFVRMAEQAKASRAWQQAKTQSDRM